MSDEHDKSSGDKGHGDDGHAKGGGHGGGGQGGAHGGGGGHEGEHEGAPEWLISFADNTALMMGFFVILLAMNMAPKGGAGAASSSDSEAAKSSGQTAEQLDWAIGVREAFNNPVNPFSNDPRDRYLAMRKREKMREAQGGEDQGVKGKNDRSQTLKPSGKTGPVAIISFKTFTDSIDPNMSPVLAGAAEELRGKRLIAEIRGHVSGPEAAGENVQVDRLAFDRAHKVTTELVRLGVDRKQLRIVACGTVEPIAKRVYTAEEHHLNERVEIVVTDEVLP